MKTVGKMESDDLPLGYELVRIDNRTLLALPSAAAKASRAAVHRREKADLDAQFEAQRKREEEAKEAALAQGREKAAQLTAEAESRLNAFDAEPAPGHHRVLRNW